MSRIKRKYWPYYLDGRQERRLRGRDNVSDEDIAKEILAAEDASLHEAIRSACEKAAAQTLTPRVKKNWMAEHAAQATEDGLSPDDAYQAWCDGRIDELVSVIEPAILDALAAQLFEDE
jgi:molybdopterin-guanine dinucleotide biosynthesis protein A